MADPRTYIRVHDGMPDHPKVEPLSDAAFRLLVTTWCWCSRHLTNGHISARLWAKRGTARTRRELIDAGLAEVLDSGDILIHDYLEHQRSAEEVQEIREAKGRGGAFGNHVRWHVRRRKLDPDCEFCAASGTDEGDVPEGSHDRSDMRSQDRSDERHGNRSQNGNADRDNGNDGEQTERGSKTAPETGRMPQTSGNVENAIPNRSHNRSVSHRKTSPETVSETETEVLMADVGKSSSVRTTVPRDDDDRDSKIDKHIAALLDELTGRTITPEHAAAVRRKLLDGRQVDNPLAYVTACIRANPRDHLPVTGVNAPPIHEARRAAGVTGPGSDPNAEFRAERERMRQGRHPA